MFQEYYGLSKEPFRLTPDSTICFEHKSYIKAKAYLQYAAQRREGVVLVCSGPGTGKTSLIGDFIAEARDSTLKIARLSPTAQCAGFLLPHIMRSFGLEIGSEENDYSRLLARFEDFLKAVDDKGNQALLIVDEAQGLSTDALEELRALTNIQLQEKPLLQFFLVGQNALRDKVLSSQLEQLHQRLLATCSIDSLDRQETADYIEYQLESVGWSGNPSFSADAVNLIHRFSTGIPRWINLICSRLMLYGMAEEKSHFHVADLRSVVSELVQEDLLPLDVRNTAEEIIREVNTEFTNISPLETRSLGS